MATLKVTNIKNESFAGNQLYLKTDGKIGIGTATPDKEFHLERNDTSTLAIAKFKNAGTGDATLQIGTAATNFVIGMDNSDSDKFKLGYGSVLESMTGMTIDSSGNVGIGTTSPSRKLQLVGSNAMILIEGSGGNGRQYSLASSDDTTGAAVDGGNPGTFAIYDDTANASRLVINSSGNVGIGTTSPSEKLEVNGVIKITGTGGQGVNIENSGGTNAACINLKNTLTNYVREYRLAVAGSDGAYATANSLFIRDQTANATRLELNTSGDVKVSSGDITFGTAGKGIVLGATSNVDANTLDDYEEGTWSPTIFGETTAGSYSYEAVRTGGRYTKIGNLVYIEGVLRISAINTAGAGHMHFGGLPFNLGALPASSWSTGRGITIIHYGVGTNSTATDNPPPFVGVGYNGNSSIEMRGYGKNYNITPDITDFTAQWWIYQITGCYQV